MSTLNYQKLKDLGELEKSTGEPFIAVLIDTFESEAFQMIKSLKESVQKQETLSVQKIAHKLKSGAGEVGATQIHRYSQLLETAARQNHPAEFPIHFRELEKAFQIEIQELQDYSKNHFKR